MQAGKYRGRQADTAQHERILTLRASHSIKETARLDYPSFSSVRLSKGRLSLRFHVAVSRVAA